MPAAHRQRKRKRRACAIRDWLSRIDKDTKEARDQRIFDLWMACHTQEEIAERENIERSTLANIAAEFVQIGKLAEKDKAAASHATDFDPPLYNIWKQQEKTSGSSHFGNSAKS
jgi:C4-dicarboxylate-specific signal transduction histidine kinase